MIQNLYGCKIEPKLAHAQEKHIVYNKIDINICFIYITQKQEIAQAILNDERRAKRRKLINKLRKLREDDADGIL